MQLTIERGDLLALLNKTTPVVSRKSTIPILANIVLTATESLSVRATDLDIEVTGSCPATVTKPGETTVNAAMLADIVKSLPAGALIEITDTSKAIEVKAGRFKTNLATLSASDFPKLATDTYEADFDIPSAQFKRLFDLTKFACSTEETRYYLQGVYLHPADGAMKAVATDGHRMALATYTGHADTFPSVIVPSKTVTLISALSDLGDVSVSISATKIRFQHGSTVVVSKVIDGTFPDYTRVIPAGNRNKLTLSAAFAKSATARVSLVSDERVRAVKLTTGADHVVLSVAGANGNDAEETIGADYEGDAMSIGFNSKYLADVMAMCNGDDVTIMLGGVNDPALIMPSDDDGVKFVVMPMRV